MQRQGKMAVSLLQPMLVLSLIAPCWGENTDVLKPLKAEGSPAGLLILPGAFLLAEQYRATGVAVQEASDQHLFVGLCGGFINDLINPLEIAAALEDGVKSLRSAGLLANAPIFAAGHSLAGVFLSGPALDQEGIRGLLMYASYLPEGDLTKYKLPVMSVSGDLDGQTRLTRVVKAYREVDQVSRDGEDVRLKYPVAVLSDVNHAHFATGKMPPRVMQEDIPSPLSGQEARKRIAAVTAAFISYHSQQDLKSRQKLVEAWNATTVIVKPFLELMEEELNTAKTISSWVTTGQRILSTLSEEDLSKVDVYNNVYEADEFRIRRPEVNVTGGRLVVNTTTNIKYGTMALSRNPRPTAQEIEAKMKRMEALKKEAEKGGLNLGFKEAVSCKEVNRVAWEHALTVASSTATKRFTAKNIVVNFEEDDRVITGPGWLLGRLTFDLKGKVLTIKSVSLVTDLEVRGPILGVDGMHYCKLLSPARALEFIYIDALKKPAQAIKDRQQPSRAVSHISCYLTIYNMVLVTYVSIQYN